MTAGQQASANFGNVVAKSVGIGTAGGVFGFDSVPSTTFGTISPNQSYRGWSILEVNSSGAGNNVHLVISGVQVQGFVKGIQIRGTDGIYRILLGSVASFSVSGDSTWNWAGLGFNIWTSTTPSPLDFNLFY
jgi:hypothetical protein